MGLSGRSNLQGGSNHVVTTQLPQEHAWRRRGAGGRKARSGGGSTRPAANDRRCAGPSVEGGIARWPWVPGAKPQLPEPFTIEKLVPMMDDAGVDRAVIVPPSWPGDRNDYALEAAKRYPNRFAVMGRIPLQNPQSAALLPKWKEQPGMLGVRVIFNNDVTIPWLTDGTADWSGRRRRRPEYRSCSWRRAGCRVRPHRGAPPAAHPHHRPMGLTAAMAKDNSSRPP